MKHIKITQKKLIVLFERTKESLRTHDCAGLFSYTWEARVELIKQIVNQQSDKLVDVK